ncbi:MAG: hypothetical protein V4584_02170 [Verrucomicrobiota bacterium]
MIRSSNAFCWLLAVSVMWLANARAVAQEQDSDRITEHDKKIFKDFMAAAGNAMNAKSQKEMQTLAVTNLRQIGLALFEFETEYGAFPNEKTAAMVKDATETKAELGAATANDCFFQLVASGIVQTERIFTFGAPAKAHGAQPKPAVGLEKCAFSYLSGMNAAGNPSRPLVVAPLVNGRKTFDPTIFGGRAVVLCVDNSVQSFPIGKDGRVMIDGRDLFDPDQPFWSGKVPPILWPRD